MSNNPTTKDTIKRTSFPKKGSFFSMKRIFGNIDLNEVSTMVEKFNSVKADEDAKFSLLSEIFIAKSIHEIIIEKYVCTSLSAYEADQRQYNFFELIRSQEIGNIHANFSNIIFGPGPQPPPRHDAHVKARAMLDVPAQYKKVFTKEPAITIESYCNYTNAKQKMELRLLKKVMKPLPGMCECTSRPSWETFETFPISKITTLRLNTKELCNCMLQINTA